MLMLLAARSRLLRAPAAARAACTVARCMGNNVAIISTPSTRFLTLKSRGFSTLDGSKDDERKESEDLALDDAPEQPLDEELSPLERLMRHSQQFQLEMGNGDEDDEDNASDVDDEEDAPFARNWQSESNPKSSSRPPAGLKRNPFRRRGVSDRQSKLGKMAVNRLAEKEMDELNYDAELESVWDEEELKLRKFHRALRREEDRDYVCTNCGERGHRARNCLVPRICPNCGGLGHAAHQCRFRGSPKDIDEFLKREEEHQKKRKQNRKLRKKVTQAVDNPRLPRPEVPTSEFNKRNENLRKELDAELDAYADMLEERAQKRKELKAQREAQSEKTTSEN